MAEHRLSYFAAPVWPDVHARTVVTLLESAASGRDDSSSMSALLLAAACGSVRSVELLLAAGASASHAVRGASTALHAVCAVDLEQAVAGQIVDMLLKVC